MMQTFKLITIPAELILEISSHLPLVYRPTTLLSLALTCRSLRCIVIPRLLYKDIFLSGEKQAFFVLSSLSSEVLFSNETDIPRSHLTQHLCIESVIGLPISNPNNSLALLQNLSELDGLPNLLSLTLHLEGEDSEEPESERAVYTWFTPSFWKALRAQCPRLKRVYVGDDPEHPLPAKVIEEDLFLEGLTCIGLCGNFFPAEINLARLPVALHTLDLHLGEAYDASVSILKCILPNLRSLKLDGFLLDLESSPSLFWKNHARIESLEIGEEVHGDWLSDFDDGMLPNLKYLRCDADAAFVLLPHVYRSLKGLGILNTHGAQGTYLLREVCHGSVLPELLTLSIHRHDMSSYSIPTEGTSWNESVLTEEETNEHTPSDPYWRQFPDQNVAIERAASEVFDGPYITLIAKAAPRLVELELIGTCVESLESLTASLSLLPALSRLIFSSPRTFMPFFASSTRWDEFGDVGPWLETSYFRRRTTPKYSPKDFEECAKDLANGCLTLDTITASDKAGLLSIPRGISARIEREFDRGPVKNVRRVKAWGCIIGKDEEW